MITYDNLAKGFLVAGQLPLDAKTYFPTLTQLKDLGTANNKAYTYYEYMTVMVAETGQRFVWKEVDPSFTSGALDSNFLYPQGTISNNIDYGNRYFNFVAEQASSSSPIGKPYLIMKDWPSNQADFLEVNDVVMGHFSSTLFMTARYLGGAVNQLSSWARMEESNPKAFTNNNTTL